MFNEIMFGNLELNNCLYGHLRPLKLLNRNKQENMLLFPVSCGQVLCLKGSYGGDRSEVSLGEVGKLQVEVKNNFPR